MTDAKVEQCDVNEAEEFRAILDGADAEYPSYAIPMLAEILARHRQAAEKATREECLEPVRFIDQASGDDFNLGWNAAMQAVDEAIRIRSQNDG